MNEDAVLLAIGGLTEAMKQTDNRIDRMEYSLGREIRDLKDTLKEENKSCRTCRDGIDLALNAQAEVVNNRLDGQDKKIQPLESLHTGEKAVVSFIDTTTGRIAICIGILSTSAALIAVYVWPVLQKLGGS
jgi:hypothetical protein